MSLDLGFGWGQGQGKVWGSGYKVRVMICAKLRGFVRVRVRKELGLGKG